LLVPKAPRARGRPEPVGPCDLVEEAGKFRDQPFDFFAPDVYFVSGGSGL